MAIKSKKRQRNNAAFTLLEMMVVMALLAIVVTIVYASFASVTTSTETARIAGEELRLRNFLASSFRSNLVQAYAAWRPGAAARELPPGTDAPETVENTASLQDSSIRYWFQGEDDSGPYGPADRLSFSTAAALIGGKSLPGLVKHVTYEVRKPDNGEQQDFADEGAAGAHAALDMTEVPVFLDPADLDNATVTSELSNARDAAEGADAVDFESAGWSVPIRTMNIQYFDGEEWLDDWDSVSTGRLPWSVHIKINFARTKQQLTAEAQEGLDPEENPDFDLIIAVPAGAGITEPAPAYEIGGVVPGGEQPAPQAQTGARR